MTIYQNHLTIASLVARIKAILRRVSPSESSQNSTALPSEENTLEFSGLVLHSGLQQASYKRPRSRSNWL